MIRTRLAGNGMALTNFGFARGSPQSGAWGVASTWPSGALAVILPFVLILVWSAAVRLPFYRIANGDEFFFSVVAREWLRWRAALCRPPSTSSRPGLFLVYAVAQAIFGASYATFKGMEIVAVALGASRRSTSCCDPSASGRLAHVERGALSGLHTWHSAARPAVNMLLQLPFVIAGIRRGRRRRRMETSPRRAGGCAAAFLAGPRGRLRRA